MITLLLFCSLTVPFADCCGLCGLDLFFSACLEHVFLYVDGVFCFITVSSLFVFLSFSLDFRNDDNGCYYRMKFMHFFLNPFIIGIMFMQKLKQSSTFQYRYQQMIAMNSRTREEGCQA